MVLTETKYVGILRPGISVPGNIPCGNSRTRLYRGDLDTYRNVVGELEAIRGSITRRGSRYRNEGEARSNGPLDTRNVNGL